MTLGRLPEGRDRHSRGRGFELDIAGDDPLDEIAAHTLGLTACPGRRQAQAPRVPDNRALAPAGLGGDLAQRHAGREVGLDGRTRDSAEATGLAHARSPAGAGA